MKDTVVGIDLAKSVFHVIGLNRSGKEQQRKKLRRSGVLKYFANMEPCLIAMEACAGAHYWAKKLKKLGHKVVLLPPQHVKAYLRGQKNDYNDARAIAEAAQHGRIRAVQIKSVEQLDMQAFHRIRRELSTGQVRIANQLRGLLAEYGIVFAQGMGAVRKNIPLILSDGENGLTPRFRELLERQYRRFIEYDDELRWYNKQLAIEAKENETQQRLNVLPGIGPVNGTALQCWMGDGKQFKQGRGASAGLGIVPTQHSSGDKQRLGHITKRGDSYVRTLIIHGMRSVVTHAKKKTDPLSQWINSLVERRGFNKAVVALANKIVRIAWVIISRGETYNPKALTV